MQAAEDLAESLELFLEELDRARASRRTGPRSCGCAWRSTGGRIGREGAACQGQGGGGEEMRWDVSYAILWQKRRKGTWLRTWTRADFPPAARRWDSRMREKTEDRV